MNPFSIFQIHVVVKLPNKGKLLIPHSGLRTIKLGCGARGHDLVVSIPHSGLETFEQVKLYAKPELSPSHTVGLEQKTVSGVNFITRFESPSHTVGLERKGKRYMKFGNLKSPSHTVGLEHTGCPYRPKTTSVGLHPTQWA